MQIFMLSYMFNKWNYNLPQTNFTIEYKYKKTVNLKRTQFCKYVPYIINR